MSYIMPLVDYLQKQANNNPHLHNLMEQLALKLTENGELQQRLQKSGLEYNRQRMELYTLECISEQLDEQSVLQNAARQEAQQSISNVYELRKHLERINFQKLLKYDLMDLEQRMKKEWQGMQAKFEQQRHNYERMENREIMKEFRRAQAANAAAQQELERVKCAALTKLLNGRKLCDDAKHKRNEQIFNFVKGAKELKILRQKLMTVQLNKSELETLQNKKTELEQKLDSLRSQLVLPQCSLKNLENFSPTTPNKLFHLFGSFKLEMPTFPSFNDLFRNLTAKPEMAAKSNTLNISSNQSSNTTLRSILRSTDTTASTSEGDTSLPKVTKHVHFVLPEDSSSSDSNSAVNSPSCDSEPDSSPSRKLATEDGCDEEVTAMKVCEGSTADGVTYDDMPSPSDEPSTNQNGRAHIEIQECIVLKKADEAKLNAWNEQPQEFKKPADRSKQYFDPFFHNSTDTPSPPDTSIRKFKTKSSKIKDFDSYMALNEEFIFANVLKAEKEEKENQLTANSSSVQFLENDEVLDFGTEDAEGVKDFKRFSDADEKFTFDLSDDSSEQNHTNDFL